MGTLGDGVWVVGSGGHGVVVRAGVEACGGKVLGFVGDGEPGAAVGAGELFVGVDGLPERARVVLAIGDNAARREMAGRLEGVGCELVSVVHPKAVLEDGVEVGAGAVVCLGAVVAAGASVRVGAIVNSGAVVDHECRVGAFSHVCPGVRLAGRVDVAEGAMVGIGSSVIQGVRIGTGAVVGAGSVVLSDVGAGAKVAGAPARAI